MVQDASLSSRRAWIEIFVVLEHMNMFHIVALLTESVDWNHIYTLSTLKRLCRSPHGERGLKYRLHRNLHQSNQSLSSRRAWIEIEWSDEVIYTVLPSLSSRRAWIEIWGDSGAGKYTYRRSPHGERGLKLILMITQRTEHMSLSSRRAWIEMSFNNFTAVLSFVALLTESVDWNSVFCKTVALFHCRSPHGERGLKYKMFTWTIVKHLLVALLTESVDWNNICCITVE